MRLGRNVVGLFFGVVAGIMGLTSLAWACTTQSTVDPLPVQSGPAGTEMTVTGTPTRPGHVEIRWNGINGPVVGATDDATASHFAVDITIPREAPPGVHYLVLVDENNMVGPAAFKVTSSSASSDVASVWSETDPRPLPTSSHNTSLVAGVALLAVGLVTLSAGTAIAAVRRREVRADALD
jgi:hypothetical protein